MLVRFVGDIRVRIHSVSTASRMLASTVAMIRWNVATEGARFHPAHRRRWWVSAAHSVIIVNEVDPDNTAAMIATSNSVNA